MSHLAGLGAQFVVDHWEHVVSWLALGVAAMYFRLAWRLSKGRV